MFETLLRRLLHPTPDRLPESDARLSLAALLVRIARSDGIYSDIEVARIDKVLTRRHGLGPFEAAKLRTDAEALEAEAPDTVRFTRAIKATTPLADRAGLMQAMWSVVLADGTRDSDEDQMLRLIANLLGLTDVASAQARHRAERE